VRLANRTVDTSPHTAKELRHSSAKVSPMHLKRRPIYCHVQATATGWLIGQGAELEWDPLKVRLELSAEQPMAGCSSTCIGRLCREACPARTHSKLVSRGSHLRFWTCRWHPLGIFLGYGACRSRTIRHAAGLHLAARCGVVVIQRSGASGGRPLRATLVRNIRITIIVELGRIR
jgi:hypothetical protein